MTWPDGVEMHGSRKLQMNDVPEGSIHLEHLQLWGMGRDHHSDKKCLTFFSLLSVSSYPLPPPFIKAKKGV
jgi:hypothetical protein